MRVATTFRFFTTTSRCRTSSTSRANDFASPRVPVANGVSGLACATYLVRSAGLSELAAVVVSALRSAGRSAVPGSTASHNCVTNYGFPNAVNPGTFTNPNTVPPGDRGDSYNQTVIRKLQYTKNFGSTAFLRVYGYTFYSAWSLANTYADVDCLLVVQWGSGLRAQHAHPRLQRELPGSDQRAESRKRPRKLHDRHGYAHEQPLLRGAWRSGGRDRQSQGSV